MLRRRINDFQISWTVLFVRFIRRRLSAKGPRSAGFRRFSHNPNIVLLGDPGISLEPEGHMVGDRRADISAAMPARKILCEIKRDYHPHVWTAPDGQLERFYAPTIRSR